MVMIVCRTQLVTCVGQHGLRKEDLEIYLSMDNEGVSWRVRFVR
jgi:hypothetical protein